MSGATLDCELEDNGGLTKAVLANGLQKNKHTVIFSEKNQKVSSRPLLVIRENAHFPWKMRKNL